MSTLSYDYATKLQNALIGKTIGGHKIRLDEMPGSLYISVDVRFFYVTPPLLCYKG